MRPKTLHLTNDYDQSSGAVRTMYHALFDQANREERPMRLIVPAEADGEERLGRFGLIYRVRAPKAPLADRRYRVLLPHRFAWPGVGRVWTILKREAPDVVEIADKYSLCCLSGILRRLGQAEERPTLVGLSCERLDDSLGPFLDAPGTEAIARAYLGHLYIGMFDAHIANSEYTAAELRDAMVPRHQRPVHVCPMGVHVPPWMTPNARLDARRDLIARCGGTDAPLVLSAGSLSTESHAGPLADVMASLVRRGSRAHLAVVGDGPLRGQLEARMRADAPGRTHFLGHVADRRTLSAFIAGADVFLHPSPHDASGVEPLAAMAAGTPLVAPASGGVIAYATPANAWLTVGHPGALAEAIESVLEDQSERVRRVAHAYRTAQQFAWPAAASRMFRAYDQAHAARLVRHAGTGAMAASAVGVWG